MANLEDLKSRWSAMHSDRSQWDSWWQELSDFVSPRKSDITEKTTAPEDGITPRLYDSTAIQANMTLAQGQLALISPMEERWFVCEPPEHLRNRPRAEQWYARCSEIMRAELFQSNFYTSIHEFYLDRSGFGTANLYMEEIWGGNACVNFRPMSIASYCIAENDQGLVDTVFVERKMTARQLVLAFGEEKLPDAVKDAHRDGKKASQKFDVIHAVYPRSDQELHENRNKGVAWASINKPYASVWFMPDHQKILRESGFEANPYLVSRYLKWSDDPWGWCPGWAALPDLRQLNYLERLLDALAEVQVFPRVLIPDDMIDEVDFSAGGVTPWNPSNPNARPMEWGSQGRYDVGLDRIKRKEEKIKQAYHVDLFQLFAQIERQMTAYEVAQRASEKVVQFSPTFARLTTEVLGPMLQRLFPMMMRRGKFPPPPMEVFQSDRAGMFIPTPGVKFVNKIAMALRSMQNDSFASLLGTLQPMFQIDPNSSKIISFDRSGRGLARNFGVPEDWLATPDEMEAHEEAMAQAAQAEQQREGAETASKVAANVSKLPPDAMQAMQQAAGGEQ